MTLKLMLAGATLALTAAGVAQAGPAKTTGLPKQPVPYTMLHDYLKASPKARAAMMNSAGSPSVQSDASATVSAKSMPEANSDASATIAPMKHAPKSSTNTMTMPAGAVNPSMSTPPATDMGADQGMSGMTPAKP